MLADSCRRLWLVVDVLLVGDCVLCVVCLLLLLNVDVCCCGMFPMMPLCDVGLCCSSLLFALGYLCCCLFGLVRGVWLLCAAVLNCCLSVAVVGFLLVVRCLLVVG